MPISSTIQSIFDFLGSSRAQNRPDQPTTVPTASYFKICCRVALGFATLGVSEIVRYAITTYQATYGNSTAKVEKHRVQYFNKQVIDSELDRTKDSKFPGISKKALNKTIQELKESEIEIEDPEVTLEETLLFLKKEVIKLECRLDPESYCKLLCDSLKLTALQRCIEAKVKEAYEKEGQQVEQSILDRAIKRRKKLITALGEVPPTLLKDRCNELSDYVYTTCLNIEKEDSIIATVIDTIAKGLAWAFNLNSYQTNPTLRETVGSVLKKEAEETEQEAQKNNKGSIKAVPEEKYKERLSSAADSYFQCIKDVGLHLSKLVKDKQKCFKIITAGLKAYETLKESGTIVLICNPLITPEELRKQLSTLYNEIELCLITALGQDNWDALSQHQKKLYLRVLCALLVRKHKVLESFLRENQTLIEEVKEQLEEIQQRDSEEGKTSFNANNISSALKLVNLFLKKDTI